MPSTISPTRPYSGPIADKPVGDLVSEDYRFAEVFKLHGIDFCCGGGRTVRVACSKKGITPETIEQEYLELTERMPTGIEDPVHTMTAAELTDHIERVHHRYVRRNIPIMTELVAKVARVHGDAHPELPQIVQLFTELSADLTAHLEQEEQVLFPFVRQLVIATDVHRSAPRPRLRALNLPMESFEDEHDQAGALMHRIRELSDNYTPPEYACHSYVVAYRKLEEFENDLHRHVHLENNVLFPLVRRLEQELKS